MNDDAIASDTSTGAEEMPPVPSRSDSSSETDRLTQEAALETLLALCRGAKNPHSLAAGLLKQFGNLDAVLSADENQLMGIQGITVNAAKLITAVAWIRRHEPKWNSKVNRAKHLAGDANATESTPDDLKNKWHPATRTLPRVQAEMPLDVAGQSELTLSKNLQARERKTIQDVLLSEGLLAVRLSTEVKSAEELQELLIKRLGQNSIETRRRYAQSIIRWFLPDGLLGLLPQVWRSYQDEAISIDLLRWSYLTQETVMGRCVAEALFPLENGLTIPATYFDKFLQDILGEAPPEKTRERLKSNLKKLGFLERAKGKPDRLSPVAPQRTSLLLLLHHLFAPKAVRTVELRNLFANSFWKHLGYKSEDVVRMVLREADASGLIGKYVVADQLEQVTTCFTLAEFLERKMRL